MDGRGVGRLGAMVNGIVVELVGAKPEFSGCSAHAAVDGDGRAEWLRDLGAMIAAMRSSEAGDHRANIARKSTRMRRSSAEAAAGAKKICEHEMKAQRRSGQVPCRRCSGWPPAPVWSGAARASALRSGLEHGSKAVHRIGRIAEGLEGRHWPIAELELRTGGAGGRPRRCAP